MTWPMPWTPGGASLVMEAPALAPMTLVQSERAAVATRTELHEMYVDNSDTYAAMLYAYGRWMPESRAAAFARQHRTTLGELDEELYWRGVGGAHAEVHCASLLSALGY